MANTGTTERHYKHRDRTGTTQGQHSDNTGKTERQ